MAIAFFDLDKTLLSVNSGSLWVKSEFRENRLRTRDLIVATGWISLYHLGFERHMERAIRAGVASLAGQLEADIRERTNAFYEREVRHLYRPGARRAVQEHRARGHEVVLLTTSSNYLSEPVTEELGLDGYLCNTFEVDDDGRFTGEPNEPLCFGRGKLAKARALSETRGVALEDCAFYTDSHSDLPVMKAVGTAVAVHPDQRLAQAAKRRGWSIVDWG